MTIPLSTNLEPQPFRSTSFYFIFHNYLSVRQNVIKLTEEVPWENYLMMTQAKVNRRTVLNKQISLLCFLLRLLNPFPLYITMSRLCFHFDHFTDGRTPWTSDQLVARPLPVHKHRETRACARAHTHTHTHTKRPCPEWDSNPRAKTVHALDGSATVTGIKIVTLLSN
jgi:hypothetical protein